MPTPPDILCRRLDVTDIDDKTVRALRILWEQHIADTHRGNNHLIDANWLRRLIASEHSAIFVACSGRHIVALLVANWKYQFDGIRGELSEFYVLPNYRRQHIGRRLCQIAEDWLLIEREETLVSAPLEGNPELSDFFAANGFGQTNLTVLAKPGPLREN